MISWEVVWGLVLGLVVGSFLKASADRYIYKIGSKNRSYCLSCKKTLRWYDLIPLVSFLFLRAKCRDCGRLIPTSNFLYEVLSGSLFGLVFYLFFPPVQALMSFTPDLIVPIFETIFYLFIVSVGMLVFWIDFKTGLIPDKITIPAIIIALCFQISLSGLRSYFFYLQLDSSPIGKYLLPPYSRFFSDHLTILWSGLGLGVAVAVLLSLLFVFLIIITKGRGMGWGDVKYVLFIGVALLFPASILSVFIAFILGAIWGVGLVLLKGKKLNQTIAFGPFLSIGLIIALLFGKEIINWYMLLGNF